MANFRTLEELRAEVLDLNDMELDAFVTQSSLDDQINRSVEQLYDLIIEQVPEFGSTFEVLQSIPDEPTLPLADDFYQLLGVDWKPQNSFRRMRPLDFARRNDQQDVEWGLYSTPMFRTEGNAIRFFPTPQSAFEVRIWYTTIAPELVADTDPLEFPNGWGSWVVFNTAEFYRIKAEDEVGEILSRKNVLTERIIRAARKRHRVGMRPRDVRGERRQGTGRWNDWGWL